MLHQHLDQFGSTVARHDIGFAHAKALAGNQRVHLHARGILRQQGIEIAAQFVFHALRGEIGIHQIAEVEHLREAPEAAIAPVVFSDHVLIVGKECLGDIQVLLVVDLIPPLVAYRQGFDVMAVQQRDDAEHVLVVLVIAHRLRIGIEEGHILVLQEFATELIDVHRLVVRVHIVVVESLLRDEVHDMLLFIQAHHRTVHPRLVFRHKGQIRTGILKDHREQTVAEHEVALYQQGIVFLQLFLHDGQGVDVVRLVVDGVLCEFDVECCMPGVDIIHQLLAFISHHDDDSL